MTLVAHPEREILIMFGGEYFNGAKVVQFFLNILDVWMVDSK